MKIRISAVRYGNGAERILCDGIITADNTTSVHDIADTLIRAGMGSPALVPYALATTVPLTIKTSASSGAMPLILDSASSIGDSGLRQGDIIEPVLESHPGEGTRLHHPIATISVVGGEQDGALYLPSAGDSLIGRDRSCRIRLLDKEVSRRHAMLRPCPEGIEIEDLGSANGTTIIEGDAHYDSERPGVIRVGRAAAALISVGGTMLRIESSPPSPGSSLTPPTGKYLPSPVVTPSFVPDSIELPSPPPQPRRPRFPLVAMVAPLLMGTVMFAVTRSPLSLIFIAISPLIMVGTWLDNVISGRRTLKTKREEYELNLAQTGRELEEDRRKEQEHRNQEAVRAIDLVEAPAKLAPILWSRRAEQAAFLELTLGQATLPSRKEIILPPRSDVSAEEWSKVKNLYEQYRYVSHVPLVEQLQTCGSVGVTGCDNWLMSAARAIVIQLTALHSPADLVFAAFANEKQAGGEWSWLKWLPHADSVYSPLAAPHLVADERSSAALILAIESIINSRTAAHNGRTVRSHINNAVSAGAPGSKPTYTQDMLPAIVVLVLDAGNVDIARLVSAAEEGPDVGVHFIWVDPVPQQIPAACRTVLTVEYSSWTVGFVRQSTTIPLSSIDAVDLPDAERFARELAPISDIGARILDESDLPSSVTIDELVQEDVLGSPQAIVRRWADTDSLHSHWTAGQDRTDHGMRAVVGQGNDGPAYLDLRTHGPHALVGGTTGSGKSEFLQTWITSLAASYSPDQVTFLLVDYKGGAAFADCVNLPHTVGLVTDLNTHLVRRALTSLRAELRYREELLAEKNAKDLLSLELRGDPEAPPALVIVVDEFAALVSEIPEFVDGVIDVAQRGRSLGLHLILATQRPSGVIKDNLRANTNLRVALRMADENDSSDVIGSKEAAFFTPETPGRAAAKVGAGSLWHFQTAYLGGRRSNAIQSAVEITSLDFGRQVPWQVFIPPSSPKKSSRPKGPRDIESLTKSIALAADNAQLDTPRKPWVAQLDSEISFASLQMATTMDNLLIGEVDQPHLQRKAPESLLLSEVGNAVIYGGPGSGKSTALLTCAYSLVIADTAAHIYGIDAGGNALQILSTLPNTGAIIPSIERDRVGRLLTRLKNTVDSRIQMPEGTEHSPILLLIDGIATFREQFEFSRQSTNPFEDLSHIIRRGRTVAVHAIFTCERTNGLPTSLAASIPERFTLRQPSDNDYQLLGVAPTILSEAPPGRAVRIGTDEEIQWACPGNTSSIEDTQKAFADVARTTGESLIDPPWKIPPVPTEISRRELDTRGSQPVFAITTAELTSVTLPGEGFMLVSGPAGSGRTTAIRSMLAAFTERASLERRDVEAYLISPAKSPLSGVMAWAGIADTASSREKIISLLRERLDDVPAEQPNFLTLPTIGTTETISPEVPSHKPDAPPFPKDGAVPLVVIEDIGGFNGTGNERDLAVLMRLLRREDIPTIIEAENATINSVWDLSSQLRGVRWAIALQPDANDVPGIFTVSFTHFKRADAPPGRGVLIRSGAVEGIHVALPDL